MENHKSLERIVEAKFYDLDDKVTEVQYTIESLKKEVDEAKARASSHYCRMLLTQHYDQRPFDETVCDVIIANGGVKTPSKKVQNICDGGCIKHGSDFSCVCDAGHTVQLN